MKNLNNVEKLVRKWSKTNNVSIATTAAILESSIGKQEDGLVKDVFKLVRSDVDWAFLGMLEQTEILAGKDVI